jgi:hypothetical protein
MQHRTLEFKDIEATNRSECQRDPVLSRHLPHGFGKIAETVGDNGRFAPMIALLRFQLWIRYHLHFSFSSALRRIFGSGSFAACNR